ncbi:tetraspanin-1-like [Biomphalaria glabrata]|uniref:Tetraspanin-1-like n=2 Tax=Biomphalaria glabrata TaxID=6526 RepID=A0A9W2YTI0_BIOGL|nr:tetraspanin-1-like [Biomphalaria glabrata]
MARFDYILAVTMAISLIWGIVILALGAIMRFSLGKLISNYIHGLGDIIDLNVCVTASKQNICPVEMNVSDDINLGDWASWLGAIVILAGFVVTIFSAVGFVAALKHSTPLIILFIAFCLIATACQFYLVQIATSEDISFHKNAKDQLSNILRSDYRIEGKNLFTMAWNGIMLMAQCCGVNSVNDFSKNYTYTEKSDPSIVMQPIQLYVPPACCRRAYFVRGNAEYGLQQLIQCAKEKPGGDNAARINTKGCYGEVFKEINKNHGPAIMGLLLFIIIWEMLQIVLGVLVKFTPPPKEERKSAVEQRLSTIPRDSVVQPKVKKFVPYSKVSTFAHPELNRIKSTEIW